MTDTSRLTDPLSIAISLGGTKLRLGYVDASANVEYIGDKLEWREAFTLRADRPDDADLLVDEIIKRVVDALRGVDGQRVASIGLATKGPLEPVNGKLVLGPGKKITTLPFLNYPIECKLKEKLRKACQGSELKRVESIRLEILHDGAASVRAEVGPAGSFRGASSACAVILGTGFGLGVIEKHMPFYGDPALPEERILGSLGRHLVYCVDYPRADYFYEYRGFPGDSARSPICSGETYGSERLAGPWLSQRVASLLLEYKRHCPTDVYSACKSSFELTNSDDQTLHRFALRTSTDVLKDQEVEIISGLTKAAIKRDKWALRQIAEVGTELGRALSAFIFQFRHREFVRSIALVSTVSERFGKDVRDEESEDLFLENVNREVRNELAARKCKLDVNIVRSQITDRELRAFTPLTDT